MHLLQKQRAGENGEETSLLFFYDYCDAVASIPGELSEIELLNEPPRSVSRLLESTIRECQAVVEGNPDMAQFRFVLSRCQLNLALRSREEFVSWSQKALEHLDILKGNFKNNPRFLTEHGRTQYRIGLYRLSSKDHAGAKVAFQHAVHSLENSLQLSPGFPETRVLLPEVHGKLALVYELLNVPTAARHHRSQESAIRTAYPHEYQ